MENVRGLGMNIESILAAYRSPFEDFLQSYLEERVDDLTASHRIGREVGDILKEFVGDYVTGGKRIRAALVAFGYGAAGGKNDDRAFSLAASIELVHSFFLVHDDIIDKSGVRRNRPTVHEEYRRIYKENGLPGESSEADHFSYSMGIIAGDVCETFAYDAILYSELSPEKIVELLKVMHKIVKETALGEILDIVAPLKVGITEQEILDIYTFKTAKYTVEGPLHLGAIMGNAPDNILKALSEYAIPIGIAFQIKDDILGVFGTEEVLGKSITSDVAEGKQTLLTMKAFEKANLSQIQLLEQLVGNPDIDSAGLEKVREVIRECGALQYSEEFVGTLIDRGKRALVDAPIPDDIKSILGSLADSLRDREY
ncbi:MAG: polyprenyl synthetase family protein [Dehalococcoidales bacterium]|jgi:geranylgeranyl diphosphate synthase type I|nr:polyprenyl synthetase family protein [Dehalococcoidales bacterium]